MIELAQEKRAADMANVNPQQELLDMGGAFVNCILQVHNIPVDFDGLSMTVMRDPHTHAFQGVLLTPVDYLKSIADSKGDNKEVVPRYKLDQDRGPKLVLVN